MAVSSITSNIASLRKCTHAVHQRLHRHTKLARMLDPKLDDDTLRWFLQKQYGFYAPSLQAANAPQALVSPLISPALKWLSEDLSNIGIKTEQVAWCETPPQVQSQAQWLGFLYVKEGALLGGQLMLRNVLQNLPELSGCVRYLSGWQSESGQRWRTLTAVLERHLQGSELYAAQATALQTFQQFERWLDQ